MRAKLQCGRIQDEVYRQMYRLEAQCPGAERDLAIALLRAWMALCSEPQSEKGKPWLTKISPICLQMIESTLRAEDAAVHCPK
jgi:hypothetical protein